jgi:hypothetical protein
VASPNPYKARPVKALRNAPGDLEAVKRRTFGVLCPACDEIGTSDDADQRRKAILAYAQVAGVYIKRCEIAELEPRLQALEAAMQADKERS